MEIFDDSIPFPLIMSFFVIVDEPFLTEKSKCIPPFKNLHTYLYISES